MNSFWCQLGSLSEFSHYHLGINSVWRQLGSPLGFAIPGDSLSGITPCFLLLGFTLLICSGGTTFSPIGGLLFFSFLGGLHYPIVLPYLNFCLGLLTFGLFVLGFNLLRHIYVGFANMSFCERISYNPFHHTSVLFTIFFLTWYDLTSYSIVLPI